MSFKFNTNTFYFYIWKYILSFFLQYYIYYL